MIQDEPPRAFMNPSRLSKLVAVVGLCLTFVSIGSASVLAEGGLIDEARFGGAWQNPTFLENNHPEVDGFAVSGEVYFAPFSETDAREMAFVDALLAPRVVVGVNVATQEDDTSSVYSAFAWQFGLTDTVFLETSFGLAANNGDTDGNRTDTRAKYGSNVLFRETLALGVKLTDQWNAIVEVEHQSHASLFGNTNRGLTNVNVKFGYKF